MPNLPLRSDKPYLKIRKTTDATKYTLIEYAQNRAKWIHSQRKHSLCATNMDTKFVIKQHAKRTPGNPHALDKETKSKKYYPSAPTYTT